MPGARGLPGPRLGDEFTELFVFEIDAGVPVLGKNTLTRAGICGPMEPRTVRRIRADTRAVFAIFSRSTRWIGQIDCTIPYLLRFPFNAARLQDQQGRR